MNSSGPRPLWLFWFLALVLIAGCSGASERLLDASALDAGSDATSADAGSDAVVRDDAWVLDAPSDGGMPPDARAIDCGEHGSFHVDHCDCDRGYRFDGLTCVELSSCLDDVLEEDDFARDATPWEDAGEGLVACPGDVDWLSLPMVRGERWEVEARSEGGELSLSLYAPRSDPRFDGAVAMTTGSSGSARVVHTARATGSALLRISSTTLDARVTYSLSRRLDLGDTDALVDPADAGMR
jgi:hypothetical protein